MQHHTGGHPFEQWRRDFENLDWSKGYDRSELMNRFPNVPRHYWDRYPEGHRFHSFNDFWNYQGTPTGRMGQGGSSEMGGGGHTSR